MKQIRFILLTLLSLLIVTATYADDKSMPIEQLPAAAKTFVSTNFKGKKITYAEKDRISYECRLDDGTKIEFDRKGDWDCVECKSPNAVPANLVPKPILQYVKANYDNCTIIKIDKKRYGHEIELSNNLDLMFNKKGAFIGFDR